MLNSSKHHLMTFVESHGSANKFESTPPHIYAAENQLPV